MRTATLVFLLIIFLLSACLNCLLYGAIARTPYFGITMKEYAEKERDIFLLVYIAGGSMLPGNEKVADISLPLIRRSYEKAFRHPALPTESVDSLTARRKSDLPAILIRILYWVPPAALALLFLVLLVPHHPGAKEEEL